MTRTVRHRPEDNKFLSKPKLSVMHAFETAVLLMEQAGVTEEDIMKYVHLVHMGWIRDGQFSPEYLELVQEVQLQAHREEQERLATEARLQALRDSVSSNILTSVSD